MYYHLRFCWECVHRRPRRSRVALRRESRSAATIRSFLTFQAQMPSAACCCGVCVDSFTVLDDLGGLVLSCCTSAGLIYGAGGDSLCQLVSVEGLAVPFSQVLADFVAEK